MENHDVGTVRVEAQVRRHPWDLPLGVRFKFIDSAAQGVWVLLSHEDGGICVKWNGIDGPGLPVCCLAESREEYVAMEVEVVA